jgi:hypothetical protein
MDRETVNITKDFTITTGEKYRYGLFFRSPIQKVMYEHNTNNVNKYSYARKWLFRAKIMVTPYLLNCITFGKKRDFILYNPDAYGIVVNELASPIYFRRKMRYLNCLVHDDNSSILRIKSFGYGGYKNRNTGICQKEVTKIYIRRQKTRKVVRRETFCFTYTHMIKRLIREFG